MTRGQMSHQSTRNTQKWTQEIADSLALLFYYCSSWESNEMCPSKNYYKQTQMPWWKNTSLYLQRGVVDHLLQQNNVLHGNRDSTG